MGDKETSNSSARRETGYLGVSRRRRATAKFTEFSQIVIVTISQIK